MNPATLAALAKIAALKKRRALAELGAVRQREQAMLSGAEAAEAAARRTHDRAARPEPHMLGVRDRLERRALAERAAAAALAPEMADRRAAARAALGVEQGVAALAARARAEAAAADARRAERLEGALAAMRARPRRGG